MARPKLGDSETERLHVKITADEITAIDDWRFANRIPSRSEAVRRLCQIGLQTDQSLQAIREEAAGVYDKRFAELEQLFKVVKAVKTSEDLSRLVVKSLEAVTTGLRNYGELESSLRQAAEKADTMKSGGDVEKLIQLSGEITRQRDAAISRIQQMLTQEPHK
ncbi:hypothetical protein QBK99_23150 [Corticibacterium sp. UT-5YL-CI-8]|nr:hypothetical protein [Tianweitania sp. UT-5YL-CI-8]